MITQANDLLKKFEATFKIPLTDAKQGSDVWRVIKQGVVSASNAHKAVAGAKTATRSTYMAELIAEVCTGMSKDVNTKYMDWGNINEDAARSTYEFMTGITLNEILFAFKDDTFRVGVSPDAILDKKGVEIKCPYDSTHFILFSTDEKIKNEYLWQVNFSMWSTGLEQWDICQYDPRMRKNPMKIVTIDRDPKKIATLDDAIPQFISDMDKKLDSIGFVFGEHWQHEGRWI